MLYHKIVLHAECESRLYNNISIHFGVGVKLKWREIGQLADNLQNSCSAHLLPHISVDYSIGEIDTLVETVLAWSEDEWDALEAAEGCSPTTTLFCTGGSSLSKNNREPDIRGRICPDGSFPWSNIGQGIVLSKEGQHSCHPQQ